MNLEALMNYLIISEQFLELGSDYLRVKLIIQEKLREWSDLFAFDDSAHKIRYNTEGPLIPEDNSKIPVLILLSNPHPHSVKQGMFLSPNRMGRENPFWETLRSSGYFDYNGTIDATGMIKNKYYSPFKFFMAVLFPFPTEDPTHLIDIFGATEYRKMIVVSKESIKKLIIDQNIANIICFGKTQYDIIINSRNRTDRYISILKEGNIIWDSVWFSEKINAYLTYPTGWRFVKNFSILKSENLKAVFEKIINNTKDGN